MNHLRYTFLTVKLSKSHSKLANFIPYSEPACVRQEWPFLDYNLHQPHTVFGILHLRKKYYKLVNDFWVKPNIRLNQLLQFYMYILLNREVEQFNYTSINRKKSYHLSNDLYGSVFFYIFIDLYNIRWPIYNWYSWHLEIDNTQ